MKIIKSRFKEPLTYYIFGTLNLMFSILINPIFHLTNGNFLLFLGLTIIFFGLIIDLGRHKVNSIDHEVESKMMSIKTAYFRNVTKKLYTFLHKYFIEGNYLCKFYRKTGTTLTFFINT